MGSESTDVRARVQALLDREETWSVATLLRREHGVAIKTHVEKRLGRAGRPVDRAGDVCADVWKDVEEVLTRRPIVWKADFQLAYLSRMANNKIVDLGKALDRQATSRRSEDGRELSLLEAISGPSNVRPDRKLSLSALRTALAEVLAAVGPGAAMLIELHALDGLDPREIAARVEADPDLSRALDLEAAAAKVAASDPAGRELERDKLNALVRKRLSRARETADALIAKHELLKHYRPRRGAPEKR